MVIFWNLGLSKQRNDEVKKREKEKKKKGKRKTTDTEYETYAYTEKSIRPTPVSYRPGNGRPKLGI